eukprot:TRINITY_DN33717_c0_g1_i1.p1 TRINITY_DN33717_c0_g1~~TRINITY_DN33717_c0_g1_i1.p1  ORF type:complete len:889 (-),score=158.22 TRINITY_DN33717_c0_g1_i1:105-2687(-)
MAAAARSHSAQRSCTPSPLGWGVPGMPSAAVMPQVQSYMPLSARTCSSTAEVAFNAPPEYAFGSYAPPPVVRRTHSVSAVASRREVSVPCLSARGAPGSWDREASLNRQMSARGRELSASATPRVFLAQGVHAAARGPGTPTRTGTPARRPPLPFAGLGQAIPVAQIGSQSPSASWRSGTVPGGSISASSPPLSVCQPETAQAACGSSNRSRSFTPAPPDHAARMAAASSFTPRYPSYVPHEGTVSWVPPPVSPTRSACSGRSPSAPVQRQSSGRSLGTLSGHHSIQPNAVAAPLAWMALEASSPRPPAGHTAPAPAHFRAPTEPVTGAGLVAEGAVDGDPEKYTSGTEVDIGAYRFRCTSVLGRGSFSEVWAGEVLGAHRVEEVALKDIQCRTKADLQQAMLEASLLERFQSFATPAPGEAAPRMRIPRFYASKVDRRGNGWRVRMAMSRVPGESLDSWFRKPPPPNQDGPNSVRRGCALALALLRQLGPTLEKVQPHAWHRDINSHNVLISDGIENGKLQNFGDIEELSRRVSFWLIDFGLAVDSTTWPQNWPHSDVAGDCRYWPPSSFLMSFCGPEDTAARKDFCNQYKTKLDVVGLGLTALELICGTALASRASWGKDGLRGSWQRLMTGWEKYREDVTRWHTMIFQVFTSGGDITPLYQQLGQERVVEKVMAHIADVRVLLRACVGRTEDKTIQRLLTVIAEMIDESSSYGLQQVLETLDGPNYSDPVQPRASSHTYQPPMQAQQVNPLSGRSPMTSPNPSMHDRQAQSAQAQASPLSEPVTLPVARRQATPSRGMQEDFSKPKAFQQNSWLAPAANGISPRSSPQAKWESGPQQTFANSRRLLNSRQHFAAGGA